MSFCIIPQSLLSSSPPYLLSGYVSPVLYHAHIHFQPTFSLASLPPALSQPTHMLPFTKRTRTHTPSIIISTIRACCWNGGLELVWLLPPPALCYNQPPTHSSISLHAGIPLATVVRWCLPSNQKAHSPSYIAYGIGVWRLRWMKIDCKQKISFSSCCCRGQSLKRESLPLQLRSSLHV